VTANSSRVVTILVSTRLSPPLDGRLADVGKLGCSKISNLLPKLSSNGLRNKSREKQGKQRAFMQAAQSLMKLRFSATAWQ
jgi:hypothetical protein